MGARLTIKNGLCAFWHAIRELSGDDGYERYLAHHVTAHSEFVPLSRAAWFACEQQKKWTGVKRCC